MEVIKVSKVLSITIMQYDGKKWGELLEYVEDKIKGTADSIMLDFVGVQTPEAWKNEAFKQLVTNERVHMTVYTNKKLVDIANLMCSMDLKKAGRIKNVDIVMDAGQSIGEKKIINMFNTFMKKVDDAGKSLISGNEYTLPMNKIISQISTETPVRAIFKVIDALDSRNKNKYKYIIDIDGMSVVDNIQKLMAKQILEYEIKGISIDIKADITLCNSIQALKLVGSDEIGLSKRTEIIEKNIPVGMVGILSKFRQTRGANIMQRIKECKPTSARVAIFRGIDMENGCAKFETFPKDYFFKYKDYVMENDGEELDGLHISRIYVDIMKLGVEDKSIGMEYHFNRPIQIDPNDDYRTWTIEGDKMVRKRVSLPVYIKGVLDDHSIIYDFTKLIQAIAETKRLCSL